MPDDMDDNDMREQLQQMINRIENLIEERKGINSEIRDTYNEARFAGFDPHIMKQIITLRAKDPHEREEDDMLLETYRRRLGL